MNPHRRRWLGAAVLAACPPGWARAQARPGPPASPAGATPTCPPAPPSAGLPWLADLCEPRVVGSGEFRWLGIRVYEARLWADHRWPAQALDWHTRDLALSLTYHRRIRRERLTDTTLDEMRRLTLVPLDDARAEAWSRIMASVWSDVGPGDVLGLRYYPGAGITLYDTGRRPTPVADADFALALVAIWLDARSRDTGLRTQLLGVTT